MWYVGVDGALNKSGVVALLENDRTPYDEQVIKCKGTEIEERLHSIRVQLHTFIRECRDYKDGDLVIAIETPFQSRNPKTYKLLSMVHAVTSLVAFDHDARVLHVDNLVWKCFVGASRDKGSVAEPIYRMWGYERASSDLTDAYALAQFARCSTLGSLGGYPLWQTQITSPFAPAESMEHGRA